MVQFQRKKKESLFSKVPLTHLLCAALLGIGLLYGAALRRVLFRNEADKVVDFVAFVRIPKTGSTSLWWFLDDYSSMENFRNYFSSFSWATDKHLRLVSCIFGPPSTKHAESEDSGDSGECLHIQYNKTRHVWLKAVDTWISLEFERIKVDSIRATMETFTMVREPFDRLRSYFDYMYERIEDRVWEDDNTPAQYQRVLEGDFVGWMELIFREGTVPHGMQYTFIDEDVDKAIELITGDDPNVIVLVNECFEASLRLLARKVSIPMRAVDVFLLSEDYRLNESERHNTTELAYESLAEMRERCKVHLAKEYKFYNAAVEQFKRQLSSLDASQLTERCEL